ncbi:MAG: asparagine synthase (glutamine-hydrolyzing), partial [Deltaproteobacteria bacterium]|nr:asparagine synthase (glutamine-hydrolyzing) [Deltaproteobacteria bacterium]
DDGFWTEGRYCALGFRRLAILDLSPAGHQPMMTPEGRYAIVYNGEVYNFRELREELQALGVRFRSSGDSEVVLHALALWGKAALHRFNGMFALGFYDTVEKRLLLARDHAGIKPIYYLLSSKGLVFASQYDQIMAHPWAKALQTSTDGLALYLRLGYIPAPRALLKDTYMLEPGAWLEANLEGQVKRGKFFEFSSFQEPDLRGAEAYEAVDAAITRAVRRHLVSDVPVGTFLSGGIDSPLVTAKAKAANNGAVRSFTVGTGGDDLDESADAEAYARAIGVDHVVEHVRPEQAVEMLDDVVSSCGEPFADYSVFPTMVIARLARQHVKVILSGDGGDELFWGYPGRFVPVLKNSRAFSSPYWLRKIRGGMKTVLGRRSAQLGYRDVGDCYRAKHTRIAEGHLHGIFPDLPEWPDDCDLFTYSGSEPNKTAQWLRWNEFVGHLTMVLLKVDRASMHHSLEVRVPLLDRDVVDVAMRVDWRSCLDLNGRIGKLPLRKSLAGHVQRQTQTKRGFEAPMSAWLRGPLKDIFQESVVNRKDILGMPINRQPLQTMFQAHSAGRTNHTRALWTVLSLALWEQKHYQARRSWTETPRPYAVRSCPGPSPFKQAQ